MKYKEEDYRTRCKRVRTSVLALIRIRGYGVRKEFEEIKRREKGGVMSTRHIEIDANRGVITIKWHHNRQRASMSVNVIEVATFPLPTDSRTWPKKA